MTATIPPRSLCPLRRTGEHICFEPFTQPEGYFCHILLQIHLLPVFNIQACLDVPSPCDDFHYIFFTSLSTNPFLSSLNGAFPSITPLLRFRNPLTVLLRDVFFPRSSGRLCFSKGAPENRTSPPISPPPLLLPNLLTGFFCVCCVRIDIFL